MITEIGKELIKTSINTYELENLDDVTYTYKIIDNENNIKEIRIDDIYIIPDVETLNKFRDEVNAGNSFSGITVIQTANIDMSSVCSKELGSWTPIGATGKYFAGTYNGNYNQINNLYISTGSYAKVGLFSQTESSTIIQNLIIENPYVYNSYSTNDSFTGAIVGDNYGKITNCASIGGTITGYQITTSSAVKLICVGGITGRKNIGTVLSCFNSSTVSGTANTSNSNCQVRIGGIIGYADSEIVSNCYNVGSINGKGYTSIVGGIIGSTCKPPWIDIYTRVTNCYNYGNVSITSGTTQYIGGIVGENGWNSTYPASIITNCYCTTETTYSYNNYGTASTEGRIDSEELKGYATTLGEAYKDDTYGINNEYPILTWQEGWLKKQKILAKAYYDTIEEKIKVEITYSGNGIKQVLTEKGKELTKKGNNTYELENLDDVTYKYKIIDTENNIKEVRIKDIYIIPDVEALNKFRDEVNAGNSFSGITVIQTANIDMSKVCSKELGSWVPIGVTGTYFAGTYNGSYNQINNLYISTGEYYGIGLFSRTATNTIIKNIVLENPYIYNGYTANHSYTGGITGLNYGKILNCTIISGSITGYQTATSSSWRGTFVGGIVGESSGLVDACYNKATISGTANTSNSNCEVRIGGVIGVNFSGIVSNCYNGGSVNGNGYTSTVGGIIGAIYKNPNITVYPKVSNCYNYGNVSITLGTSKYMGGIAGCHGFNSTYPAGEITNSYCTTGTTYSYYKNYVAATAGRVDSEVLKGYASTLGDAFVEDTNNINNGYPILAWQEKIKK